MRWELSNRCDPTARAIADRHYNRQHIGADNFVPPGRCIVLLADSALWVTSWPFAEYVRHAWAGAWVNSLFRNEGESVASELIREAVAATRYFWEPPELGLITFINPKFVKPTMVRGKETYGFCYRKAGFKHVGYTKGGLIAMQLLPCDMPDALPPDRAQFSFLSNENRIVCNV